MFLNNMETFWISFISFQSMECVILSAIVISLTAAHLNKKSPDHANKVSAREITAGPLHISRDWPVGCYLLFDHQFVSFSHVGHTHTHRNRHAHQFVLPQKWTYDNYLSLHKHTDTSALWKTSWFLLGVLKWS